MPYASNSLDGCRVYFEDDGGDGVAVVIHGGLLDSVDLVRGVNIAQALQELPDEFRLIYVNHRGLGRSDKPHDAEAYAMPLRVGDAVTVLDELGMERAHFIGENPPIIIGHSAGGLLTQILLDHGYGAAGVAIDSVPAEGIRLVWVGPLATSPPATRRTTSTSGTKTGRPCCL